MVYREKVEDGTVRVSGGDTGVLIGEIKMWPATTAPAGYLLCNGSTFSSTTYPELAALLGNSFGTSSGTTYYLPDFRGRSPAGVGPVTPVQNGNYSYALGQKYGQSRHALSVAEQPAVSGQVVGHGGRSNFWSPTGAFAGSTQVGGYQGNGVTGPENSVSTITFSNGGQNATHENTPPILGINFIIRAA